MDFFCLILKKYIFWIFFFFLIFRDFIFFKFFDFILILFLGITFRVNKVTTKSYQGYYWTLKIAQNGPKQNNKLFFPPKKKPWTMAKALRMSSKQALEVIMPVKRTMYCFLSYYIGKAFFSPGVKGYL